MSCDRSKTSCSRRRAGGRDEFLLRLQVVRRRTGRPLVVQRRDLTASAAVSFLLPARSARPAGSGEFPPTAVRRAPASTAGELYRPACPAATSKPHHGQPTLGAIPPPCGRPETDSVRDIGDVELAANEDNGAKRSNKESEGGVAGVRWDRHGRSGSNGRGAGLAEGLDDGLLFVGEALLVGVQRSWRPTGMAMWPRCPATRCDAPPASASVTPRVFTASRKSRFSCSSGNAVHRTDGRVHREAGRPADRGIRVVVVRRIQPCRLQTRT